MKKVVKSNPLKTFNDNKALAVKKMGGAQAAFKKSLPKAQDGINKKGKPMTFYSGSGDKFELDTNGYAKRENNFYPYTRTVPAGAGFTGVFDRYDMNTVMSSPAVKAQTAVAKEKAKVEAAKMKAKQMAGAKKTSKKK